MDDEWRRWAEAAVGEPCSAQAADVALRALRAGASAEEAAAAGRLACGQASPPEVEVLRRSQTEIEAARRVVARAPVRGDLTQTALAALDQHLEERARALDLSRAPQTPAAAPAVMGGPGRAPQLNLREFFADHSIQLLAYSGAFLAAVAVLLFDLSGSSPGRFYAVAALNLAFAAGGWLALRRAELRVVAQSYVALSALLLPLTGLAAYVFLHLGPLGVSVSLAVAAVAAGCAAVYLTLARILRSEAYAALGVVALGVCVPASVSWTFSTTWAGPGLAALAVPLVLFAERSRRGPSFYTRSAEMGGYAAGLAGTLWGLGDLVSGQHWHLSAALGFAVAAGCLRVALSRRPGLVWLPASLTVAWALALARDLSLSQPQGRGLVIVMALAATAAAWQPRVALDVLNRGFLRILAAMLLLLSATLVDQPSALQAGLLCGATAVGLLLALSSGGSGWLWVPALTFGLAWYWLVLSAIPPPPSPGGGELARAYAPLPLVFLAAGLAARAWRGRSWAWPAYMAAGIAAAGVVALSLVDQRWTMAGTWLLVYAALAYAAGLLERSSPAVVGGLLAGAGGVAALLAGAGAHAWAYLAGLALAGLASELASELCGRTERLATVARYQRWLGEAELLGAVAGSVALGGRREEIAAGTFCALLATSVLAGNWWLRGARLGAYLAPVTFSMLGVFAARAVGLQDPQWQALAPAVAIAWTGTRLAEDPRLSHRLPLGRAVTAAGAFLLFGTTGAEAASGPDARHIAWLAVEAALGLGAAILGRSRTLMACAALAMSIAATLAAFLLAQATSLALVFGLVAGALLVVATALAVLRTRLTGAGSLARGSWEKWA